MRIIDTIRNRLRDLRCAIGHDVAMLPRASGWEHLAYCPNCMRRWVHGFYDSKRPSVRVFSPPLDPPRIVTALERTPLPYRQFDWAAWDDNTYDPQGEAPLARIVGYGRTKAEAIEDFKTKWREAI